MAIAVAVSTAAGCSRIYVSADQKHEKAIAAGIGLRAQVACFESVCHIISRQPFSSHDEAWFIALSPVSFIWSDTSHLQDVTSIVLKLVDAKRDRSAVFRCSLREKESPATTTVDEIRRICTSRFGPAY
jgi:hypothetical protein